jgi:tRNA threonylcarbamoyladenosine biosynthesis protein TsaB
MIILTLRTDNPQAELGLYSDDAQLAYYTWQAHRELAETLHLTLQEKLDAQKLQLSNLQGIVVFKGPGSFTGLRIGVAVANALAESLAIPIVGTDGDDWATEGITRLLKTQNDRIVLPEYGALPRITAPRK